MFRLRRESLTEFAIRTARETGKIPAGATVYVDRVEAKPTGDEFLDLVGMKDVEIDLSVILPPEPQTIHLTFDVVEPKGQG